MSNRDVAASGSGQVFVLRPLALAHEFPLPPGLHTQTLARVPYSVALLSLPTLRAPAVVTTAASVGSIAEGPPVVPLGPDAADSIAQTRTCVRPGASSDVPNDYVCPILQAPMEDPVVAADGRTYERSAIEQWINQGHSTSPLTNQRMSSLSLRPNINLRNTLDDYKLMKNMLVEETRKREELEAALEDSRQDCFKEARKREELEDALVDARQDNSDEITVRLPVTDFQPCRLGVWQHDLVVTKIEAGGLVDQWNSEHLDKAVKVGDKIVCANVVEVHSPADLVEALRTKEQKPKVSLRFRRRISCESESLCAMIARRFGS